MEINTIVVGYDGSPNSDLALDAAADIAGWSGATLHCLAVSSAREAAEVQRVLASMPEEFRDTYSPGAHEEELLRMVDGRMNQRSVDCQTHHRQGDPADTILSLADEVDAELIVVGSRGLARGTRHLRGSVSTRIAGHAQRDFLVVHEAAK